MTGAVTGAIQHATIDTRDPDVGHAAMRQLYVDHEVRLSGAEENFHFSADTLVFAGVALSHMRHSMRAEFSSEAGLDQFGISLCRRPGLTNTGAGRSHRLGAGDVLGFSSDVPFFTEWDTLDADATMLNSVLLEEMAAPHLEPGQTLRFAFELVSGPAADTWRRTMFLARRVATANATNPDGRLLADELARLLTSTALSCIPNTTMRQTAVPRTQTTPASLRRGVAWIDTHLDQPISLADIAAAARVSPRALNLTFNRHLHTSPIGYVRQARLDRAHRDLTAASPDDGTTVTAIAARWGFYSLPRFGVTYRKTYGQPPSHTLRQT